MVLWGWGWCGVIGHTHTHTVSLSFSLLPRNTDLGDLFDWVGFGSPDFLFFFFFFFKGCVGLRSVPSSRNFDRGMESDRGGMSRLCWVCVCVVGVSRLLLASFCAYSCAALIFVGHEVIYPCIAHMDHFDSPLNPLEFVCVRPGRVRLGRSDRRMGTRMTMVNHTSRSQATRARANEDTVC